MVQAANEGGRNRTGDLDAQRRAQEEARRRAEEAARKAAEEAARKAAEQQRQREAQRQAESKPSPNAEQRQEGYLTRITQRLSAESARLQNLFADYAKGEAERRAKTPRLTEAKMAAQEASEPLRQELDGAQERFPDASDRAREKVGDLQRQAERESKTILDAVAREADAIVKNAEGLAVGKAPEDQARIMAVADQRAAAVMEKGLEAVAAINAEAGKLGKQILSESHEYQNKNWFEKRLADVGNALEATWDGVTTVFDKTADIVGDIADFAAEQANALADWAGEQTFKLADTVLDSSPLGEDAEYTREKTGVLGDLVTNRLELGEAAFIKLDVDANIGGVALGAGAELMIKRVPATDAQGEPRTTPLDEHGEPPTELQVTLIVDARAGVGLEAQFGVGGSTEKGPQSLYGNDLNLGASAGASASVEAGVQAEAEFTFTFDPTNQQDMDDLTGIVSATAKTALPAVGALAVPDAIEAAANFGRHLTSVRGEVGIYATAQVSAGASIGQIDEADHGVGSEVRVAGTEGKDGQLRASGNRVVSEDEPAADSQNAYGFKGTATGMALEKANLDLVSLTAGINGEVNIGGEHNFRTEVTTLYLNVQGGAEAQASALGMSAGAGVESNRTIAIRLKGGEIQGIDVVEEMSGSTFQGIGTTDIRGRLQEGVLMRVGESDTVKVTRSYTPEALASFKSTLGSDPTRGLADAMQSLLNPDPNPKLEVTDIKATKTEEISVGFQVAGTGFRITAGQRLESDLDTISTPGNLNAELRGKQAASQGSR